VCERCPSQTAFKDENNFSEESHLSDPVGRVEVGLIPVISKQAVQLPSLFSFSLSLSRSSSFVPQSPLSAIVSFPIMRLS
jgi:hypothetical protein